MQRLMDVECADQMYKQCLRIMADQEPGAKEDHAKRDKNNLRSRRREPAGQVTVVVPGNDPVLGKRKRCWLQSLLLGESLHMSFRVVCPMLYQGTLWRVTENPVQTSRTEN